MYGIVKWFSNSKGFGFLYPITQNCVDIDIEYFFHYNGYKNLYSGQKIKFDIINTENGKKAINIKSITSVNMEL